MTHIQQLSLQQLSLQQLREALVSPFAIFRGRAPFYVALIAYLSLGLLIFGVFGYWLVDNQHVIKQAVMSYLLPQSWHYLSDKLLGFFFESQTKVVLASMVINGSLVIASIILFPLKEYCSARFEEDGAYNNGPPKEFPLWLQALEESKLLLLYLTAQSVIFAIGYYPYEWCNWLSSGLSIVFLCFSFGLDLIAPTLQRHRIRYTSIIQLLSRKLLVTMLFGGLFALPLLLLGNWILMETSLPLAQVASILFLVNMFALAIAIPAGTHIASALLAEAKKQSPLTASAKRLALGVLLLALAISGGFHARVALSMHHKSQFLKCEYDLDWSSVYLDMPSLGALFKGEKEAVLRFNLTIHNPTPFDLSVENSVLSFWQKDNLISRTHISAFSVASGQTVEQPMQLKVQLNGQLLTGFSQITEGWRAQLEFELLPGIPFIIELLDQTQQ